jgi:hypothetical protein
MSADDTPAPYDGLRGAAALVLAVAEGRKGDAHVILGCVIATDRRARIAWALACWLVRHLRARGASPEEFAHAVLADLRDHEARR